jgi:DNA-binding winged helix-turn-helix (wHTH) protein
MTAYCFGNVEVRPDQRQVLMDKRPVTLGARAFDVLTFLLENQHRLVAKEELLDSVWPGEAVIEHNLVVQVSALRALLGRECIATVPGRGYRFVAGQPAGVEPAGAPASPPDTAHRTNLPPLPEPLVGRAAAAAARHVTARACRHVVTAASPRRWRPPGCLLRSTPAPRPS